MSKMDRDKERLRERYAAMEDGELNRIASEWELLSDAAREALRDEMRKRKFTEPMQSADTAAGAKRQSELPMPQVIRRYRDVPQAMIAQSLLDSAGIESFLADDNLVRMDWMISNAIGGVKLLVRPEDREAADQMLEEAAPQQFDLSGIGEYIQPKCTKCGSLDIVLDEPDKYLKAAGFVVGLPLQGIRRGWSCHICGNRWEEE